MENCVFFLFCLEVTSHIYCYLKSNLIRDTTITNNENCIGVVRTYFLS